MIKITIDSEYDWEVDILDPKFEKIYSYVEVTDDEWDHIKDLMREVEKSREKLIDVLRETNMRKVR